MGNKFKALMDFMLGTPGGPASLNESGKLADAQIPGLDKLGAAPAGFGLGETNAQSFSDANACTKSGLYADHTGSATNVLVNGGLLRVSAWTKSFIIQELFLQGRLAAIREYHANTGWIEWEWVNPPMEPGVEYRTTERYMGKPVYTMLVDCGAAPTSGYKFVDLSSTIRDVSTITDLKTFRDGGGTLFKLTGSKEQYRYSGRSTAKVNGDNRTIYISIEHCEETEPESNIRAILRYTKTTD